MSKNALKRRSFLGAMAAISLGLSMPVHAQQSGQTMKIVVAYPPGGSPDSLARVIAQNLSPILGHSVIVENRPGAGGMVAVQAVKNAVPDGYTLFLADSSTYSLGPNVRQSNTMDALKDFVPVGLAATSPIVLTTGPSIASNLKDFIAHVKSKPNLAYGSSGVGTGHHLAMEMLKKMAGIQLEHVPYKGAAQTLPAVMSGEVTAAFGGLNLAQPLAKAGRVNILGIASPKRSSLAPEIPTLAEAGIPGYGFVISLGVFAPAKTPPDVVNKLNAAITKALQVPAARERLIALGVEPETSSPRAYSEIVAKELDDFGKIVKSIGLKPE